MATALILVVSDLPLSRDHLQSWSCLPLSSLEKILSSFLKHFFFGLRRSYPSLLHWSCFCIPFLFLGPSDCLIYSLPREPPGPAPHLNANDPLKLVFPALPFTLRSRLVYPPTQVLSPLEWAVRILTLTFSKQNFYCSLLKLSASQVLATQFFRPSPFHPYPMSNKSPVDCNLDT